MAHRGPWPTLFNRDTVHYRYRPLKKNHIRTLRLLPSSTTYSESIITIECEIVHIPLNDATPYEALSYVWGSDALTRSITINSPKRRLHYRKEIIHITESLWNALIHLRKPLKSLDLWVDQLCINQNDESEKSSQVGKMGEIYGKSSTTII
jgi:hypothetical protein